MKKNFITVFVFWGLMLLVTGGSIAFAQVMAEKEASKIDLNELVSPDGPMPDDFTIGLEHKESPKIEVTLDDVKEVSEYLSSGVGIMGTAGGSLKAVAASVDLLEMADEYMVATCDAITLKEKIQTWYDGISDDERAEYKESFAGIAANAEGIINGDEFLTGLLEDSGVSERAEKVKSKEFIAENFAALKEIISNVIE